MCKIYKVKFQLLDCRYDFTNQHDIVQDISSRRRRFELELLSSNNSVNSVIKLLHARSRFILSLCFVFLCACFSLSFVCICHSVCAFYCVVR